GGRGGGGEGWGRWAEEPGALAVRHVTAGTAHRPRQEHMRRYLAAPALQVTEHAADMRMLDAAGEQPARLHHLMAGVMDGGGRVVDTAEQRILVGMAGPLP